MLFGNLNAGLGMAFLLAGRLERVADPTKIDSFARMTLQEIEREALALGENDRAALLLSLMQTLPAPGSDVGDDEALRRDEDMESGKVAPISHEEFVRRVGASRAR